MKNQLFMNNYIAEISDLNTSNFLHIYPHITYSILYAYQMMLSEVDKIPTLLIKFSNDKNNRNLLITPTKSELSATKSMSNITDYSPSK